MASTLPPVAATPSNHFKKFLLSCEREENCRSPVAIARPLCQVLALGVVPQRLNANLVSIPHAKNGSIYIGWRNPVSFGPCRLEVHRCDAQRNTNATKRME